jgi:hypothetical protein
MNNLFKLLSLVGTGLILGSMAGQFLKTEKWRLNRILGIEDDQVRGMKEEWDEATSSHHEELENCFI